MLLRMQRQPTGLQHRPTKYAWGLCAGLRHTHKGTPAFHLIIPYQG
jgi:hypothetical protein